MAVLFKVDTKGVCIICLTPENCRSSNNVQGERESIDKDSSSNITAFKILLRYLKVDTKKVKHLKDFGGDVNLSVTLCSRCASMANEFLQLFQEYERIRLKLELSRYQLNNVMEEGGKDKERVLEFERRLKTRNRREKISTSIAESLRKEMMKKVSQKVESSIPRISLQDMNKKPENVEVVKAQVPPKVKENTCNVSVYKNGFLMSTLPSEPEDIIEKYFTRRRVQVSSVNSIIPRPPMAKRSKKFITATRKNKGPAPQTGTDENIAANTGKYSPVSVPNNNVPERSSRSHSQSPVFDESEPWSPGAGEEHDNDSGSMDVDESYDIKPEAEDADPLNRKTTMKRNLKCNYCDKMFFVDAHLKLHTSIGHQIADFQDKGLLPSDISEQQLNTAVEDILSLFPVTPVLIECPLCGKGEMSTKFHLKTHLLTVHVDTIVENAKKVAVAAQGTSNSVPRRRKELQCAHCDKKFNTFNTFREHQIQKHLNTFLKGLIPPSVSEEEALSVVSRTIAKSKKVPSRYKFRPKFECFYCKKIFCSSLSYHLLKKHHEEMFRELRGGDEQEAAAKTLQTSTLELVESVHYTISAGGGYACISCKVVMPSLPSLKRHVYRKHPEIGERFKCDLCEKSFVLKRRLHDHQVTVHPVAYFAGANVPIGLSDDDFLASVARIVDKSKKKAAENDTEELDINSISYHGEYECQLCGQSVTHRIDMRLHVSRYHLDKVIEGVSKTGYDGIIADKCQKNPVVTKLEDDSMQMQEGVGED